MSEMSIQPPKKKKKAISEVRLRQKRKKRLETKKKFTIFTSKMSIWPPKKKKKLKTKKKIYYIYVRNVNPAA